MSISLTDVIWFFGSKEGCGIVKILPYDLTMILGPMCLPVVQQ